MAFRILFLYAYGLAQLHVVCLRRTVTVSSVAYLFLVGAITCVPIAYFAQLLLSHYFPQSASLIALRACAEDLVKALVLVWLFFGTRSGMYGGLLDGVLCGAAIGAGFGFAEDAIFTVENARLPYEYGYAGYTWSGILLSWFPGGWPGGNQYFPGHPVVGALIGAAVIFARRGPLAARYNIAIGTIGVIWAGFLHVAYNAPGFAWPWVMKYVHGNLDGYGAYARWYVLAVIVLFLVLDEKALRRWSGRDASRYPQAVRPASMLVEISGWLAAIGKGVPVLAAARTSRLKWELFNLDTVRARAGARQARALDAMCEKQIRRVNRAAGMTGATAVRSVRSPLAHAQSALRDGVRQLRERGYVAARSVSGFASSASSASFGERTAALRPAGEILYALLLGAMMAQGFYFVFLSPQFPHKEIQDVGGAAWFMTIGMLGQFLVMWRCIRYLTRDHGPPLAGATASVNAGARYLLAWGGLFTNFAGLKILHDNNYLPYPLHAAGYRAGDLGQTIDTMRGCVGDNAAGGSTGGTTSPVPPAIDPPKKPQPPDDDRLVDAPDPGLVPGDDTSPDTQAGKKPTKPIDVGIGGDDFGGKPPLPPLGGDDDSKPALPPLGGDGDDLAGQKP